MVRPGLDICLERMPLIAILRGILPEQAREVALALDEAGFTIIEVPLNSPRPFQSIAEISDAVGDHVLVGAGTITAKAEIVETHAAGGRLAVMPHCDWRLVEAARTRGLEVIPGILTPSEAFLALRAGAHALKMFPAEMVSPAALRAVLAILPKGTRIIPVGGITADNMADYWRAGAAGFGCGSALFKPGKAVSALASDAARLVTQMRQLAMSERSGESQAGPRNGPGK